MQITRCVRRLASNQRIRRYARDLEHPGWRDRHGTEMTFLSRIGKCLAAQPLTAPGNSTMAIRRAQDTRLFRDVVRRQARHSFQVHRAVHLLRHQQFRRAAWARLDHQLDQQRYGGESVRSGCAKWSYRRSGPMSEPSAPSCSTPTVPSRTAAASA
jgi:hypothetical protein